MMRSLRIVLIFFLALHVVEIIAGVRGLCTDEPTFLWHYGDLLIDTMLADVALSGISFLVLSVLGVYILNKRIPSPPSKTQLLLLSILHFVMTLGVAAVVLMLVLSGNISGYGK